MSRLVPQSGVGAAEIVQCSDDVMAIVALCENAAFDLAERGPNGELANSISVALKLALKLMGAAQVALEQHESVSEEVRHERAA